MVYLVGFSTFTIADDNGIEFQIATMYPTSNPIKSEKIGPYTLNVAMNAEPLNGQFPLVLISHGSGGSYLLYRDTAKFLASNGFIVGMLEHPFNNRLNNTQEGTIDNLINRPLHIQIAINWFYNSSYTKFLKPNNISIIGHSLGGYTALALAGGVPTARPHETLNNSCTQLQVAHDTRIKAIVLLAPATIWFNQKDALKKVICPILVYVGDQDEYTGPTCSILLASGKKEEYMPYGYHVKLILDGIEDKNKVQIKLVKNAGHFSFLSPFPENMVRKTSIPTQDPKGFNRNEFQLELNTEILTFLTKNT